VRASSPRPERGLLDRRHFLGRAPFRGKRRGFGLDAFAQLGKGFGLFYEGLGGFGFAGQSIRPLSWAVGAP